MCSVEMFLFPRLVAVVVAAIAGCWCWCCCVEAGFVTVFEKGKDGYACFRIPAIVQTRSGTLLAFAEGRKLSCADHGWNDLVMKRSTEKGFLPYDTEIQKALLPTKLQMFP